MYRTRWPDSDRIRDCCFLFLLSAASTVPYLRGLGFYSDDWGFVSVLTECKSQWLGGLCACLWREETQVRYRPLQVLELATFYRLFRLHPLGYHVLNSVIFCVAIVFFYLALRELDVGRFACLTVSAVYAFIPHYSTDRFWIAAAQANLSTALCFFCFYFVGKASGANAPRRWLWLWISIVGLTGSIFAYESSAPLFALVPILLYLRLYRLRAQPREGAYSSQSLHIVVCSLVTIVLILIFKYSVQTYVNFGYARFHFLKDLMPKTRNALLLFIDSNYGAFSIGLPSLAWRVLREHWDTSLGLMSVVAWLAIVLYFWMVARGSSEETKVQRDWIILFLAGTIVYWVGYALFFPFGTSAATTTGVANRVMITMAAGTAMTIVSLFGIVSTYLSRDWLRNGFLALGLSVLCLCGFIVIASVGSYWRIASLTQSDVLSNVRDYFPTLPTGTILLLDGVCPYIGPGIVFETDWDVSGALRILYHDPTIVGDIVTPRMAVQSDRLVTSIYGGEHSYRYSDKLILFDVARLKTCQMKDSRAAQACLDSGNWKQGACPVGREGTGVPVF